MKWRTATLALEICWFNHSSYRLILNFVFLVFGWFAWQDSFTTLCTGSWQGFPASIILISSWRKELQIGQKQASKNSFEAYILSNIWASACKHTNVSTIWFFVVYFWLNQWPLTLLLFIFRKTSTTYCGIFAETVLVLPFSLNYTKLKSSTSFFFNLILALFFQQKCVSFRKKISYNLPRSFFFFFLSPNSCL